MVDAAINALNSALARGLDWRELAALIDSEKVLFLRHPPKKALLPSLRALGRQDASSGPKATAPLGVVSCGRGRLPHLLRLI